MSKLEDLLVPEKPESDFKRRQREVAERKKVRAAKMNACRSVRVSNAIVDILGEGEYARVWIGRTTNDFVCQLSRKQMNSLIEKWNEATDWKSVNSVTILSLFPMTCKKPR